MNTALEYGFRARPKLPISGKPEIGGPSRNDAKVFHYDVPPFTPRLAKPNTGTALSRVRSRS